MPDRDPTCSVDDCTAPTDGVLTIATPRGSVRLSACEPHGRAAVEGDWLTFILLGHRYLLGPGGDGIPPADYEPLRR